ncbi:MULTISPECIES: hypothetical protein [Bradyrhizobium]|uniref:Uncharacterized protein n=1 Tax=Bradyrhizobium elkanii TaxID=29448 RepID=A0A4U6S6E9_BRAEL|nr:MULTISPECIES: hypothetical protein [Bradyrhizobium]MTV18987.1 hypothetical protein [Bradyrhizobium sp. BR2003]TKV83354.1 hypothetical protein FDV58_03760 [Bradyrhizobium elkanii]
MLAFLLVSGEQTSSAAFGIPNEAIEQMARKNDGVSAKRTRRLPRRPPSCQQQVQRYGDRHIGIIRAPTRDLDIDLRWLAPSVEAAALRLS